MFCHKCGAQINEGAIFCYKCGEKIVYADTGLQEVPFPAAVGAEKDDGADMVKEAFTPSVEAVAQVENTANQKTGFKAFVDSHVQQTTKFQSAEELLNSRVPQKFMWICFGIPAVIGFLAGGLLAALLIGAFFGYPAALLTDFIKGFSAKGSVGKIKDGIDTDGSIQFLNKHLSYLSPHFHEWGYINYSGFGVRSAVMAHTLNSVTGSAVKVGTEFGRKQRCFAVIWIEPDGDGTEHDSKGMKYYFSTAMRLPWPSKYICMVKAVPILQAAMEYYLKYNGIEGGNENVLS